MDEITAVDVLNGITDNRTAMEAGQQLSEMGAAAIPDLLWEITDGADPLRGFAACYALGNALATNPDLPKGRKVAKASDWTGLAPALLGWLDSLDVNLRSQAARVLGLMQSSGAVNGLKKLLADDRLDFSMAPVWVVAADALQRIGSTAARAAVEEGCISKLAHENWRYQGMAAQFLERNERPQSQAAARRWHIARLKNELAVLAVIEAWENS